MYRFVLAIHLIAVISWMAGLLYLLRLFVYHAEEREMLVKERFKLMEERLLRIITLPASWLALSAGLVMIFMDKSLLQYGWMHVKLFLVILLLALTHGSKRLMRQLAHSQCQLKPKSLRILNEVPTVLMILIVFLAVLKLF